MIVYSRRYTVNRPEKNFFRGTRDRASRGKRELRIASRAQLQLANLDIPQPHRQGVVLEADGLLLRPAHQRRLRQVHLVNQKSWYSFFDQR